MYKKRLNRWQETIPHICGSHLNQLGNSQVHPSKEAREVGGGVGQGDTTCRYVCAAVGLPYGLERWQHSHT